ncbi:MAG: hypothetical protein ACR2K0_06410 [Acidimicrobiales bacterium]
MSEEPAIACSLEAEHRGDRTAEWQVVLDRVVEREQIDGGVRLQFGDPGLAATIADLAAREHECCPFFGFVLRIGAAGLCLEVDAPEQAGDVVVALFGDAGPH